MILKKLDKQSILYLIIVIVIAVLVCIGFFYYRSLISEPEIEDGALEELKRERIIKKQLEELNALIVEMSPLTEKEIEDQVKNLDKGMPGEALTEEQIQAQLDQLNKLFKEIK